MIYAPPPALPQPLMGRVSADLVGYDRIVAGLGTIAVLGGWAIVVEGEGGDCRRCFVYVFFGQNCKYF